MSDFRLSTPVLFLIFNRPDTTARVFEEIRRAQPPRLYIAADGPRPNKPEEAEKVKQARNIALKGIDWPCEVKTQFRDENLGCKQAVSGGLDWFFENEEAGIILEDDVVPHPTFFRFCEELLAKYKDDTRIMAISGDNFQGEYNRVQDSYYFSHYFHCWGWATWRRAYLLFDPNLSLWPQVREGDWLKSVFHCDKEIRFWSNIFQSVYENRIDSWAYGWTFSSFIQNGLTVTPAVNLVTNIGFGVEATHTKHHNPDKIIPSSPMIFPLQHPAFVLPHGQADQLISAKRFKPLHVRIIAKVRRVISHYALTR